METGGSLLGNSASKVKNIKGKLVGKDGQPLKHIAALNLAFLLRNLHLRLRKRLAFPIVKNYVKNAWVKYGIERVNKETWKASNDVESIMNDSDSEEVENDFVEDNEKHMDELVDDA
ncbi:hypothetical protein Tco_0785587 [Tanacetum coccineum]